VKRDAFVYRFHGFAAPADFAANEGAFRTVAYGFAEVRDTAVLSKQPIRVRVVQVDRSGSFAAVVQRLGAPEEMTEQLATLNGHSSSDRIEVGTWLKVVRE